MPKLSTRCTLCSAEYGDHAMRDKRCPVSGNTSFFQAPPIRPRGRPPLTPEQRMTTLLSVRTSASERAELEATAAAAGKDVSAWAREILLRATSK